MTDDSHFSSLSTTRLSVVVPLYNEEESVEPLYNAIVAGLAPFTGWYEIVFVDDGSVDKTFETASALAAADPRLRVIKFRANFGQTPAMAAGIDHAVGDVIVTMDGDLQNDPSDILMLVAELEKGNDLVVGWRFNRQDKLVTRKIPSVIANRLLAEGVPRQRHQEHLALLRDASLHPGHGVGRRSPYIRGEGAASRAPLR
jgi:glycosyltransferase involved in cell wall biosynthesis